MVLLKEKTCEKDKNHQNEKNFIKLLGFCFLAS